MAQHNETGKWGEDLAEEYLRNKGYTIRERNWRLGHRDVDIIASTPDDLSLVFVEVRTRTQDIVMDPVVSVNPKKMLSIAYCANAYIHYYNLQQEPRFDIIGIVGTSPSSAEITHIEDAFNPCML